MKHKYTFAAMAAFALAALLPSEAGFYWLAVGIHHNAGNNVNGGLGNYLVLTNDDPEVVYNPVKLYDVRRTTDGGTKLRKVSGQSGTAPYEGCPKGGAHYDLTLPIRDAEGNVFTFVGLENEAFKGNNFIGSIKLPDTMEYINYAAFWQAYYLADFQWPSDVSNLRMGGRTFDTCTRLVGPMEWPEGLANPGDRPFTDCTALVGFGGPSVTNVGDNAFQNCPALRMIEFGEGESVTFGNVAFQGDSALKTVLFHDAPPVLNKYILGFDPSNGSGVGNSVLDWWGSAGATVYVPFNAAKDGPTAKWAAFKTAFEAAKMGNEVTWPTDNGDGTWTDGRIYNVQFNKSVKLRFWNPDAATTSALLAY